MTANTYGRQVVVPLTNKSGGAIIAGDVVVIDTGNNDAFTTTTSAGFTGGIGVAQEAIANNAIGRVLVSGYAALVNVNASVTRGNFGATHTVAKQAAGSGSRGAGTFCQFLTGGTTPTAVVYPADLAAAALTNPMTTAADLIVGGTSGVPARLAKGSDGQVLTVDPSTHLLVWATPSTGSGLLQTAVATRTAGDLTTTSTSFVDATGITVTLTTGAHRCIVLVNGSVGHTGGGSTALDIDIDGSRQGQTLGLAITSPNTVIASIGLTYLTGVLSAASHTIKLVWRVDTNTGNLFASTSVTPLTITVIETALTT